MYDSCYVVNMIKLEDKKKKEKKKKKKKKKQKKEKNRRKAIRMNKTEI